MTEPTASRGGAHAASPLPDTTGSTTTAVTTGAGTTGSDPTLGAIVNQLTTQVPELIRSEIKLAQAEVTQKGKRVGVGIGMFSGAGLMAFFGFGTLLATIILALSLVMDAWLAALIVTVVLFVIAGVLALLGKNKVAEGTPLAPERAVEGVKEDIATVKGQHS